MVGQQEVLDWPNPITLTITFTFHAFSSHQSPWRWAREHRLSSSSDGASALQDVARGKAWREGGSQREQK